MIKVAELPEISFSDEIFNENGPFPDGGIHYSDVADFMQGVPSLAFVGDEWSTNYGALDRFLLEIEENGEVYDALEFLAEIGWPVLIDEYWRDELWPVLTEACNIGAHFLNNKDSNHAT